MAEPHGAGGGGFDIHQAEELLILAVEWLKLVIEFIGAGIIALGLVVVCVAVVRTLIKTGHLDFTRTHIRFARYLSLALEFQLAADIVATAVAPSWEQIGKLGAIAVIRTALNFFLQQEIKHASAHLKAEEATHSDNDDKGGGH